MALTTLQVTLGAGATRITTANTPALQIIFSRDAADYYIGKSDVDSTHGVKVDSTDTENLSIGPFSGGAPMNANEFYLSGTQSNVIQVLVITH